MTPPFAFFHVHKGMRERLVCMAKLKMADIGRLFTMLITNCCVCVCFFFCGHARGLHGLCCAPARVGFNPSHGGPRAAPTMLSSWAFTFPMGDSAPPSPLPTHTRATHAPFSPLGSIRFRLSPRGSTLAVSVCGGGHPSGEHAA